MRRIVVAFLLCLATLLFGGCSRQAQRDRATISCIDLLGNMPVGTTLEYAMTIGTSKPSALNWRLNSREWINNYQYVNYTVMDDELAHRHTISFAANPAGGLMVSEIYEQERPMPTLFLSKPVIFTSQQLLAANPYQGLRWEDHLKEGQVILHQVTHVWTGPSGERMVTLMRQEGNEESLYTFSTVRGLIEQRLYETIGKQSKHLLREMTLQRLSKN